MLLYCIDNMETIGQIITRIPKGGKEIRAYNLIQISSINAATMQPQGSGIHVPMS